MENRTNILILTGLIVVVLGGAFYFLQHAPNAQVESVTSQEKATTTSPVQPIKEFTLEVKDRKLVSGSDTLGVNQGDAVLLHITVDEDEELHLHGYDVHIDLEKDKMGTLALVASSSGRFPFELEHSGTELGALEVQPK